MMRTSRLLILVGLLGFSTPFFGQGLLSDSLMVGFTKQELINMDIFTAQNGVDVYRIKYETTDAHGDSTIASGAIVVPRLNDCFFPMMMYHHGTSLRRTNVPSRLSDEITVGYFGASTGYLCLLPDYLGLGDSPGLHPYIHSESEASACIDMLYAAKEFAEEKDLLLNQQLFLLGYSQGGHSGMATFRELEANHQLEFPVTAAAFGAGPYDVSGVQSDVITSNDPYPAPNYLPYVILSYMDVYQLYDSMSQVFKSPYDSLLPALINGENGAVVVDNAMPIVPNQILQDSVLDAFRTDTQHIFRQLLRENDVYEWLPNAPLNMYYCEADAHVTFMNSIVARDWMVTHGAMNVQAISKGINNDHETCVLPALLEAKSWFDQMKFHCDTVASSIVEVESSRSFSILNTIARDVIEVDVANTHDEFLILNSLGQVVRRYEITQERELLSVSGLMSGIYYLTTNQRVQTERFFKR